MLKLSCVTYYTLDKAEKRARAFETFRQVPLKQIDSKLDKVFLGWGRFGKAKFLSCGLTPKEVEFGHRSSDFFVVLACH